MAKSKQKKSAELESFKTKLGKSKIVLFTSFAQQSKKGVDVASMRKLKKDLRGIDSEYVVIKKTLAKKAFSEIMPDINVDIKKLSGSLGLVLGFRDQVVPAQFIYKFSKQNDALVILGGVLDKKLLSGKEVIELAKLPSRDVLLAQVFGTIKSPIQGFHNVLQANLRNLVLVLSNIKQ